MSESDKIEPYLLESLPAYRSQLLQKLVDEAFIYEIKDEKIEEREYDENERLRKQRIINRKVFRGETYSRYASFLEDLQLKGSDNKILKESLNKKLDEDLKIITAEIPKEKNLSETIRRYGNLLFPEQWPAYFCMVEDSKEMRTVKKQLDSLGLLTVENNPLEKFRVIKFTAPPEIEIIREISNIPQIFSIADPQTPVISPEPVQVTTRIAETRKLLEVSAEMMENYGRDITLAILDTGIDLQHPAFSRMNPDDYKNFIPGEDHDFNGHGTHCACIAAGNNDRTSGTRFSGVAPLCNLVVGKVISGDGKGSLESILNGMAWVVFEKKADILSLSIGEAVTPANGRSIWTQACDETFNQGTVICIAAGNTNSLAQGTITVPADSQHAVTVGAVDKQGSLAIFSAKGSEDVDSALYGKPNCVAPGVHIVAARSSLSDFPPLNGENKAYTCLSGTSMAAPAVAGCLALLKSYALATGWQITPKQLVDLFYQACHPVENPDGLRYSQEYEIGHGLVDMKAAFSLVDNHPWNQPDEEAKKPGDIPAKKEDDSIPGLCYSCGKEYSTKIAVFSPLHKCEICEAPICMVCWHIGNRRCLDHKLASGEEREKKDVLKHIEIKPEPDSTQFKKTDNIANFHIDPGLVNLILGRFEEKILKTQWIYHPELKKNIELKLDQKQSYKRDFGHICQFSKKKGLLKKKLKLIIALVILGREGLIPSGSVDSPEDDIFSQITGKDGLDFQDEVYYIVGLYSPGGWPKKWRSHVLTMGNASFYLVEECQNSAERVWDIHGKENELIDLFDPESIEEKEKRVDVALKKLYNKSKSVIRFENFLKEYHLNKERDIVIENITKKSKGFLTLEEDNDKQLWIRKKLI